MIDVDQFLGATVESEMQTRMEPVPEGEYTSIIVGVDIKSPKEGMVLLEVQHSIDDAALADKLNRQEVKVRQTIFLDVNDNGLLDLGPNKNVALGRLRAACNQNVAGKPWSPSMLEGAGPLRVIVRHRPDKNDPEVVYDEVSKVAPA